MKRKLMLAGAVGLSAGLVVACHDDNSGSAATPPPTSATQSLDSTQVLALAQQTSETSSPFAVSGGALLLTDTSETSSPIGVNQP